MKFHYSCLVLATIWVSTLGVALADGECSVSNPCKDGFCCSNAGYCGTGAEWCDADHCQSQCWTPTPPPPPPAPTPPAPPSPISDIIDIYLFDELLKHRNETGYGCQQAGFYTYYAFITAANYYPQFGTTGDTETRKREIAAFFAQTSHETTGGWDNAPDGPYAWGYCFVIEQNPQSNYCDDSQIEWRCEPGKSYKGRGPIQLSWNYNYGPCGVAVGYDLLKDPDAVANDAVLAFKSALWFWMTPQAPKPSCHDVITGKWTPTEADVKANRLPGYGVITNIINGGLECGVGPKTEQANRIGFYKKYCDDFGLSYGDNIDCYDQRPFGSGITLFGDI